MEKLQISYEMYQSVRKYEKETNRPIATSLLLQIGEVLGEWKIMHVISIEVDKYDRYLAHVNILDTFKTQAEAKMKIRALKKQFSELYNVKFNNKGDALK